MRSNHPRLIAEIDLIPEKKPDRRFMEGITHEYQKQFAIRRLLRG